MNNIAEGFEEAEIKSSKDFYIAKVQLAKLDPSFYLAVKLGYIQQKTFFIIRTAGDIKNDFWFD